MLYENTKTGAIINSPCTISGGDWVEVKPEKVTEEKPEKVIKKKEESKSSKSKKKK